MHININKTGETTMKKVLYFNMPSGIKYEQELLQKWGIEDFEIEEIKGEFSPAVVGGYSGIVSEYIKIGEDVFSQNPQLKIASLQCIGYDDIDVISATKHNVCVTNTPGYCSEDVATHAMALLLSVVRQTAMFASEVQNGKWDCFSGSTMNRLSGKKAGLISFGNIPQRLVPMLKGFGIEVFAFDIYKSAEEIDEQGATKIDSLKEILGLCDFIFLHTPLTSETKHMINRETLAQFKDGAILINASRGGLVCEKDLVFALKSGKLKGVGTDVLEDEQNISSPLLNTPNVTITPHVAFLSEDSLKQSREMALRSLVERICESKIPSNCVNGKDIVIQK